MLHPEHPEVLAPDWVPPVLVGRAEPVGRLLAQLIEGYRTAEGTTGASVVGPPGSGTSAVARRAGLRLVEEIRRTEPGPPPLFAAVRARWAMGATGVATELLRHFDPAFEGRGFPVAEILAGFIRRIVREKRSGVIVLDDLGTATPDIGPVVRALVHPSRFLPEGADAPPKFVLLLAGSTDARACWDRAYASGFPRDARIELNAYTVAEVEAIVEDRAARALGRSAPVSWASRIVSRALRAGPGARHAIELLKREMTGPCRAPPGSPYASAAELGALSVEPRLLVALQQATLDGPAGVAALKEWEARLARAEGARPLPATTLWRRILRLEAAGVVRRDVRTGGNGGTRSRLELLRPVPGVERPIGYPSGSPRGVGSAFGSGPF